MKGRTQPDMKKIINELIQWQDLMEARAQKEAIEPGSRLTHLDEAIAAMQSSIPAGLADTFLRIRKKAHIAIVPVINGVCAGCGLGLPTSLSHDVRASKQLHRCPNCSRYLFHPEAGLPRRTQSERRMTAPARIGIARFSSPDLMFTPLAAKDGDQAIRELCAGLQEKGYVDPGDQLAEEALKREAIFSTALDIGVAFPHVRGVEGGGLTLALGISPEGIRFRGGPREPIHIIFFFVIPTAASAFYLRLLSGLTRVFGDGANRNKLLLADAPATLWKVLAQTTRKAIP